MVLYNSITREVLLLHPGPSLLGQVAEWARHCEKLSVRVSDATGLRALESALAGSDLAVVDAAEDPQRAMDSLQLCLAELDPRSVAVYTERTDPALEIFTRVRGSALLLGPMESDEWDAFFRGLAGRDPQPRLRLRA